MSLVVSVLAVAMKLVGVFFIFAAALGVLRFKDPLQRMHAATKSGTIGASLVLAGTVLVMDSFQGRLMGILPIIFLFLTVPIASHLLGRAVYVSGTDLVGIEGNDALEGVLERPPASREARSLSKARAAAEERRPGA